MSEASKAAGQRSPAMRGADEQRRAVTDAVRELLRAGDAQLTATMSLVAAGQLWLDQIDRPDSGMSRRTIIDYAALWKSYVGGSDSTLRQLTLAQANDLSGCACSSKALLTPGNSLSAKDQSPSEQRARVRGRQRRPDRQRNATRPSRQGEGSEAESTRPHPSHDTLRTRPRDRVAYEAAAKEGLNPRATRKRQDHG